MIYRMMRLVLATSSSRSTPQSRHVREAARTASPRHTPQAEPEFNASAVLDPRADKYGSLRTETSLEGSAAVMMNHVLASSFPDLI